MMWLYILAGFIWGIVLSRIYIRWHYGGEMVIEEDQDGWGKVRLVVESSNIFDKRWVYFKRRRKNKELNGAESPTPK